MSIENGPIVLNSDGERNDADSFESRTIIAGRETNDDVTESATESISTQHAESQNNASDDNNTDYPNLSDLLAAVHSIQNEIGESRKSYEKYMLRNDLLEALKDHLMNVILKEEQKKNLPSIKKAISIHDSYNKLCTANKDEANNLTIDDVIRSFDNFIVELENLLIVLGIDHFDDTDKDFDSTRHEVIGVEATDDPSRNNKIGSSSGFGYEANGFIFKQKVRVYKYKEA